MEERYEQIEFNSDTNELNEIAVSDEVKISEENRENEVTVAESSVINSNEAEAKAESTEVSNTEVEVTASNNTEEAMTENTELNNTDAKVNAEGTELNSSEAEVKTENTEGRKRRIQRKKAAVSEGEQADGTETAIAPEKMPKAEAMRVLEAIMFANGDEVYYDQFAKIIGYTTKEAIKIVDAYAKMYDSGNLPRGIRFVRYDKCCQLTTCPDLGEYVTQMIGIRGEPQLSAAAMETLAIVAYNQPVTRAYIEQVRRVDSTRPITVLLDRELIEEKGRLDVIGRPRLFGTTQNFLKTFGITSLDALPSLDLFAVEG